MSYRKWLTTLTLLLAALRNRVTEKEIRHLKVADECRSRAQAFDVPLLDGKARLRVPTASA